MMYQKNQIFVLATLAAAGADVVADTTIGRLSIQESGDNKFTVPIFNTKVTKLETATGASLIANKLVRDLYGEYISGTLEGDLERDAVSGTTYQLYEFEFSPQSTDHGGYIPGLRPKLYLYVNATTGANVTAFEQAITAISGIINGGLSVGT